MAPPARKDKRFSSQKAICEEYQVTRRAVANWIHNYSGRYQPFPEKVNGAWRKKDIDQWRSDNLTKGKDQKPIAPTDDDLWQKQMRRRRDELELQKAEQDLAIKTHKARATSANFHSEDSINEFMMGFFTEIRRSLMNLPDEMCTAYSKKVRDQVKPDLKARLETNLNQWADWLAKIEDLGKEQ